jgi:hypothetical protein
VVVVTWATVPFITSLSRTLGYEIESAVSLPDDVGPEIDPVDQADRHVAGQV